jgi:crotonobetainyl-CoA:carnitine CoA-transferase CaiB-like acyl-CoA transferase
VLEVDLADQRVVVEPGVTNLDVSRAVAPTHFFPPDPSSQVVCSIGGNVAENSGGAHCFKYGFTTNYVTGLEVVLPDGEVVALGGEPDRPGYDLVVQGEAGLMALNGEADQPPLKFGVAVVDLFTGMYSAQAILAALYQREKTGKGRHVEMALFDCGLMITAYYGLEALLMGEDPPRYGNSHPSIVPYGVFDAADGPLVITVGNNAQFARFCTDVIDRPDLAADERFKTNILRSANRAALLPELQAELARRPRDGLLEKLTASGIPCGEVLGLLEALNSKRATDAGLVTTQPHPVAGTVNVLAPPYRFDGERLPVRSAPPTLGEGTHDVLQSLLGLSDDKLAALKTSGVV